MPPFDPALLDDPDDRGRLDSADLLRVLAGAGAQVRAGTGRARELGLGQGRTTSGERPRAVHLAAVGGSGGATSLLTQVLGTTAATVVSTGGSGPLPGWVGPLDLVVAMSVSGRAGGPVAQAREAARRGAYLVTVGAPDSPLAEAAQTGRGVHVEVRPAEVGRHSRTGLWALVTAGLLVLDDAGVLPTGPLPGGAGLDALLAGVADRLDAQAETARPDAEHVVNPAKVLAEDLSEVVPVVLGDGTVSGAAAERAAAMLARTGRTPAMGGRLPDDAAEVLACLGGPFAPSTAGLQARGGDLFADPYLDGPTALPLGLLLLRGPTPELGADPAELARHDLAEAVAEEARSAGVRVREVSAGRGHELEQIADLVALTDMASTYLALGHGLDPARAPGMSDLRSAVAPVAASYGHPGVPDSPDPSRRSLDPLRPPHDRQDPA